MTGSDRMTTAQIEQCRKRTELQLLQNPGLIGTDCFGAQVQVFGNVVVRLPLCQQPQHRQLLIGEFIQSLLLAEQWPMLCR
ncbi:hypothetical protein D3C79_627470 [compost metagenome]